MIYKAVTIIHKAQMLVNKLLTGNYRLPTVI